VAAAEIFMKSRRAVLRLLVFASFIATPFALFEGTCGEIEIKEPPHHFPFTANAGNSV
jgi:hypothetical protein